MSKSKPNPKEQVANVEPYRHYFCEHYDKCLWRAVWGNWQGFHCLDCEAFSFVPKAAEDVTLEASRCAYLLGLALGAKRTRYAQREKNKWGMITEGQVNALAEKEAN